MNKNIEKIINELVDLGYSERKILNRLKEIKNELIKDEDGDFVEDKNVSKQYNKLINSLVFGPSFYIEKPTPQLLGLLRNIRKVYGSEYCYYILYNILTDRYFNYQIHEKSNDEKCNWLMFLLKENNDRYYNNFVETSKVCKEPF